MAFTMGGGGGSTAAAKARAKLAAGGGAAAAPTTPYQIPIRTGAYDYLKPVNRGQFDGDVHTRTPGSPKEKAHVDLVDRFNLTDDGVKAAMGAWYTFTDEQRGALAKRMWYLGLVKDPNDFDGAYSVWQAAVQHAGRFALAGREIDPQDVLELMGDASGGAGKKQKAGPITKRQVDLTDPETAKAWIQQAFQQSMGRAPEDAEVRALADALQAKERANPTVQTTTPTKWDDQGNPIDSTTTTTGGFNSQAYLQNRISADPEANAHQAAGELYPALMAALGGGLS